jgi:hypothetical protein
MGEAVVKKEHRDRLGLPSNGLVFGAPVLQRG